MLLKLFTSSTAALGPVAAGASDARKRDGASAIRRAQVHCVAPGVGAVPAAPETENLKAHGSERSKNVSCEKGLGKGLGKGGAKRHRKVGRSLDLCGRASRS